MPSRRSTTFTTLAVLLLLSAVALLLPANGVSQAQDPTPDPADLPPVPSLTDVACGAEAIYFRLDYADAPTGGPSTLTGGRDRYFPAVRLRTEGGASVRGILPAPLGDGPGASESLHVALFDVDDVLIERRVIDGQDARLLIDDFQRQAAAGIAVGRVDLVAGTPQSLVVWIGRPAGASAVVESMWVPSFEGEGTPTLEGIDGIGTQAVRVCGEGGDVVPIEAAADTPPPDGAHAGTWYSVFFTQPVAGADPATQTGAAVETELVNAINNATATIDAAFFELQVPSVTEALIAAHARGVRVRLVLDDDHGVLDEDSTIDQLRAAGMTVYCEANGETPGSYDIRCDDRGAFMHHKFLVIDEVTVWTGSMNATPRGIYRNNNSFIRIESRALAANYLAEFDEMFTQGIFSRRDDPGNTTHQLTLDGTLIENYFAPEDGDLIIGRTLELINAADSSIDVMMFSLTLDPVGEALLARHNAGIAVRGVFEARAARIGPGEMTRLACGGVPVREDGNPGTMHHRVIIIDRAIVITGSLSFSQNAIEENSENVLIIHSPALAQQYLAEFERQFNAPEATDPLTDGLECP